MRDGGSPWNSLEVTKLLSGLLTPIILFTLGFVANGWVRRAELAREEGRRTQLQAEVRAEAVRSFSRALYGRRTRAELVVSSLRRGAELEEVRRRKRDYDAVYVEWNTNHKANLLTIREIVADSLYTEWESQVEFGLVPRIFAPMDACVTRAYDARLAGRDPNPILDSCDISHLLQRALDCSHAIAEGLFQLTGVVGAPSADREQVVDYCSA